MQGVATQAMRCHRRGAATPQMPSRRRAPAGNQQSVQGISTRALKESGELRLLNRPFV
jgi:hypothetical protein